MRVIMQVSSLSLVNMKIIVAINDLNGIGYKNQIPWFEPEDLKFFKKMTVGCSVIMGRNTYESMGKKPLVERQNVVVSSRIYEKVDNATNLDEALAKCKFSPMICGGVRLYNDAMRNSRCTDIYVSKIRDDSRCDTFFDYQYVREHYELKDVMLMNERFSVEHYVKRS